MSILVVCQQCGKEFKVPPSRHDAKFCSKDCKFENIRTRETEHRHKVKCDNCGVEFMKGDYRLKVTQNNFCSYECHDKFRENKVSKICEGCGKEIKVKESVSDLGYGRFCSWSCRSKYMVGEKSKLYNGVTRICELCNKEFVTKPSEIKVGKGKFCSKKCWHKSMELERPQDSIYFYGSAFWLRLREECYKRDNYTCQKCGNTDVQLDAHHIVPRTFGGNDELSNLISLCNSCHHIEEFATRRKLKKYKIKHNN